MPRHLKLQQDCLHKVLAFFISLQHESHQMPRKVQITRHKMNNGTHCSDSAANNSSSHSQWCNLTLHFSYFSYMFIGYVFIALR